MKSHFPIINYFEKKHIIYADSAATTLKLKTVIDSVSNFYSFETSNVFRGLHLLAETATEKVEMSRDIVAAFIGANSSEIVFTSGATESIQRLLADRFFLYFYSPGDCFFTLADFLLKPGYFHGGHFFL